MMTGAGGPRENRLSSGLLAHTADDFVLGVPSQLVGCVGSQCDADREQART